MNSIGYFEIQADDPGRAVQFYTQVFGWKFVRNPAVPIEYWQIQTESIGGGLLQRPATRPGEAMGTNAYVCSMEVQDFDATAAVILQNGGQVAMEKFAIPGRCWQGYFLDPEGNTFGVFQVDEQAR